MSTATRKPQITAICYDKKGRVLSTGRNSYIKTHPLQAKFSKQVGMDGRIYLHAEVAAIVKCFDWERIKSIHIFRYGANGRPLLAKPCPACQALIDHIGIKDVVYTTGE